MSKTRDQLTQEIISKKRSLTNLVETFSSTDMHKRVFIESYFEITEDIANLTSEYTELVEEETLQLQRQYDETRH